MFTLTPCSCHISFAAFSFAACLYAERTRHATCAGGHVDVTVLGGMQVSAKVTERKCGNRATFVSDYFISLHFESMGYMNSCLLFFKFGLLIKWDLFVKLDLHLLLPSLIFNGLFDHTSSQRSSRVPEMTRALSSFFDPFL